MPQTGPDLDTLRGLFPGQQDIVAAELVTAAEVPEPFRRLLCHEHHMTVTVEAHHGELVDVEVLNERSEGDTYSRQILLALQQSRRYVLYGIVRIHLNYCTEPVRREILAKRTPLGRILIEHNILRRIEPTAYLRIAPGPALQQWFGLTQAGNIYGRLAIIHCDEQPAIELLEVVVG